MCGQLYSLKHGHKLMVLQLFSAVYDIKCTITVISCFVLGLKQNAGINCSLIFETYS